MIALTKSLGKELASINIAVNCITPAAARTRIFEQMTQEHIDYMLSKIPRGRFVKVRDRLHGRVACQRGELLHYRRHLRSQRRPGYLLACRLGAAIQNAER